MKRIFPATILTLALTATAAWASSGKTADGCTYKVINGQYLTSCDPKPQGSDQIITASAAPEASTVTSYGSVPMRSNPDALVPSVQAVAPQTMTLNLSAPVQSSLVKEEPSEKKAFYEEQTYVGAQIGSTNISEAGSGTGLGASIGTSLDEYFNLELGYNYSSQGLNLGLDTRGNSLGSTYPAREDATLKSHLITAEFQGYATSIGRRLRPYLGLGLGWKSSSLAEKTLNYYGQGSGGRLSQSSFGGTAGAGAKFGVSRGFSLGVAFRYFFPFARQDSSLRQQSNSGYGNTYASQTRLSRADELLTGASQYQLQGGLEYSF